MNFSHEHNPKRNLTGITVVVLIHILLGWAVISGTGVKMVAKLAEPVVAEIIEEKAPPPPPEVPPPPPPPELQAPPPPFIPPVEVNVQQPPPVQNTIQVTSSAKPPTNDLQKSVAQPVKDAPPTTNPAPTGVKVNAVVDFTKCSRPEYPKSSLRNEETGTVTMSFLISVDGRVKESTITKGSGFRDLDRAAKAALEKCTFRPATIDGKPVEQWSPVQYVWQLD
jgi:periplasmic protein TonB